MRTAHRLIHVGSTHGDLTAPCGPHRESPREDCRRAIPAVPTQRRLLFNGIRVSHEGQHVAEGAPLCITVEADDNHVFTMAIDRIAHKGNQTVHEELCLIHNNCRRRGEFGPLQNCAQPAHIHCTCWNRRTIMIDNRRHRGLIAIVNIGRNNENTAP